MKEALFILLVLVVLAGLTAYRYRRQIRAAMELYRAVKSIRERTAPSQPKPIADEPVRSGTLVHCQKCGSWVPEDGAIRLGRSSVFCSTKCLETSRAGS